MFFFLTGFICLTLGQHITMGFNSRDNTFIYWYQMYNLLLLLLFGELSADIGYFRLHLGYFFQLGYLAII